MKARFFALMALVLGLASCQTDMIDGIKVDANGEAPVTIQVGLPQEAATRAAGADSALGAIDNGIDLENTYDIRYILGVYDEKGELAKRIEQFEDTSIKTNFALRLVPGRHYRFVVWADFVEQGKEVALHYDASDLKDVKLTKNMGDNQPMDESRDAYTGIFNTEVDGNHDVFSSTTAVDITLTRPFAKLRVVTNDMQELYSDLTEATVSYRTPLYTSFNALTATPEDPESNVVKKVNYSTMFYANETNPRENGVQTLFADYFFGAEDGKVHFTLEVKDGTDFAIPAVDFNTDIPVQRNYLTTIYGPVLTDANNVTVTINDDFTQPGIDVEWKEASTAQELADIFEEANNTTTEETHIVLNGDINLDDLLNLTRASSSASVTIASGKEVVLDIKDFTITGTDYDTASYGMFNIQPGAKLTIEGKNGKIQLTAKNNRGWNAYSSVISNQRGEFVLNGGTIEHLGGTDMAYGLDILTNTGAGDAKATINGGVVKSNTYRAVRLFLNSTKATAELVVNGGTIDGRNNKSIWMQNANASVNPGKLVVAENANLYGDVMVSGNGAPELAIELSVAEAALKNGATVIPSNIPAGYDIYVKNGNWVVEYGVEENDNEVTINNAAGLKLFANKVNGGETFAGKTVKLGADIDLNNQEWTPIGSAYADHGFMGNFDGNGYTIKNLTIKNITPDADGYVYAGLFGVTEGTNKDNQNYIKNLVIENVDIDLEGHIVAAAIAYPYYTDIENVTVKGNVSIKGGHYTAGVLAYTRRCVDAKNISIVGNEGSVIEGGQTVGGVISDIQTNGGLVANYSNFAASGLTIKATKAVGGISGIISAQTLDGATVKNVHIDCDVDSKGIVAGSLGDESTITNVSYENVTGATRVIGATYDGGLIVVSTADELIAALEAGKGVYLFNDITIDPANMSNAYGATGINVLKGQTIDGGNHTLNINGAGGTWDSGINTTGGVIKNLTVTGAFRGIFINHTGDHSEKVVLKNVTTTGTVYTISCDQGKYQGIEATDCAFYGWTSFAKTAGEAKFTNCYFGEGSGYKYCRPYSNTEFVGCTFCPGYAVDTTRATVTFTDCTWEE